MLGDGACRFFLGTHQMGALHSTSLKVHGAGRLVHDTTVVRDATSCLDPHPIWELTLLQRLSRLHRRAHILDILQS